MAFRFAIRFPDGSDAGEVAYPDRRIQPGDEIRIDGNQLVRVLSVIPPELASEFVDGADVAVLEVEAVAGVASPRMPTYSLDFDGPDGPIYVAAHEFPSQMHVGDTFEHDGWTWQVTDVATKQFDPQDEPGTTLRCRPA